jgi:hypothetical protein
MFNPNTAPFAEATYVPAFEAASRALKVIGGGGHVFDWDNMDDPLRRAILGQGPKRPFGK